MIEVMRHNTDKGGVWSFDSNQPAEILRDEEVYDTDDLPDDHRTPSLQQNQQLLQLQKNGKVGAFVAWNSQPLSFPMPSFPEGSCLSELDEDGSTAALARSRLRARLAAGSRVFFVSERYGDRLEDECFSIDSLDHGYSCSDEDEEEETVCCPSCGNEFAHIPNRRPHAKATLVERYNRLQYETALLEADLRKAVEQQTKTDAKEPFQCGGEALSITQLAEHVSVLSDRIREMPSAVGKNSKSRVDSSSDRSSPAVEVMMPHAARAGAIAEGEEDEEDEENSAKLREYQQQSKRTNQQQKENSDTLKLKTLVDLDKRLSALEKTVGCADTEAALGAAPLCETVIEWRKRLLVLTAAQLEALRGKIKDVQDSMAELRFANNAQTQQEKPSASGDDAQQVGGLTAHELAQVQKVLENMERWEKTRKALPEIVERLRTLAPLHEASASFVEQLDEVENRQEATQKMMDDLQLIVVRLEQSLALNSKRLADNMQSLESRIAQSKK